MANNVIDSCLKNHVLSTNLPLKGTQCFNFTDNIYYDEMVNMVDMMGILHFLYAEGVDTKLQIIEITSKKHWTTYRLHKDYHNPGIDSISTFYSKSTQNFDIPTQSATHTFAQTAKNFRLSQNTKPAAKHCQN